MNADNAIARNAKSTKDRRKFLCVSKVFQYDRDLRSTCHYRHSKKSAFCPSLAPQVHITFGVIPESGTTRLVTFEVKSRTVCINTTITCGAMPNVSQDLDVWPDKIWY
jgi:hypothetical protein